MGVRRRFNPGEWDMNEKYKAKFEKAKELAKKHGPVVLAWTVAGVAAVIATRNQSRMNRMVDASELGPDDWASIPVSPRTMGALLDGATLKYRMVKKADVGEDDQVTYAHYYIQSTTENDFSEEANEKYNSVHNIDPKK